MRKCLRCGAEMKEGCDVRIEGAGSGIVLSTDAAKLFGGRIGGDLSQMWRSVAVS